MEKSFSTTFYKQKPKTKAIEFYIRENKFKRGKGLQMSCLIVELKCPEHGLERFKIKVIKKYNINPRQIMPKFRSRPKYELSSIVVGKCVHEKEIRDYVVRYFAETGLLDNVLSIRLKV